jgi:hypothetical protein
VIPESEGDSSAARKAYNRPPKIGGRGVGAQRAVTSAPWASSAVGAGGSLDG